MSRPWTEAEIQLLGTKPDAEVGRLIGRPGKAVWAKRHALGIDDPPSLVRRWSEEEDKVALSRPVAEVAAALKRTVEAVKIRRAKTAPQTRSRKAATDSHARRSQAAD